MLALLGRAVAAAGALLARNPAARKAGLQAARKAAAAFKSVSRSAVQGCKWWARNRGIRAAYNARKQVLAKELTAMRQAGAPRDAMARKAYEFRRQERLAARRQMRANGDTKSVEKLEARDAAKYGKRGLGDKDGPNFEGLQRDAAAKLEQKTGRKPSQDEINDHIIDSATRTDLATNVKFLTF
ncbi:MAG: hypothetical protein JWQ76_3628 [Ramlibacter sp.]|nr:hypothetical protein [Ramlibacter sp.]